MSETTPAPAAARAHHAVGGLDATLAIAGLTWTRLWRGKAIWISLAIALLPVLVATVVERAGGGGAKNAGILTVSLFLLSILPPLHIAASLAEEIEDRTAAYLWSRPIPRWTIITGKMLALVPLVMVFEIGGGIAAAQQVHALGTAVLVPQTIVGLGAGVIAASCVSVGLATVWPKHGMAIAVVYILALDGGIGAIPAGMRNLSLTHHTWSIVSDGISAGPLIGLAAISAVWLAIALRRIRTLE